MQRVVVVGGGIGGLGTAQALRRQGYAGRLTLVGGEQHLPYDRPPLSKQVLRGARDDSTLDADWDALDVELLLGRRAVALDSGSVEVDGGGVLDADAIVVATGAVPRQLPDVAGPQVRTLRTIEDSLALRAELRPGRRIVIVGAGWIGAEVATAAAAYGCQVTVVEALGAPLAAALPPEIGARTMPWYEAHGIDVLLGTVVDSVEPDAVHLVDGIRLPADCTLVAIGVQPATDWLTGSTVCRDATGAIEVNPGLRSSLPEVWALGDCASWESLRYGRRVHVEHWDDALHAPEVAAVNVQGGAAVHDPVPYIWSEQLGRYLQYAGQHADADRLIWRGDPDRDSTWSICWLRDDRLVAVLAVDRPRDLMHGRRLAAAGTQVDQRRLADPSVPLRAAVLTGDA